MFLSRRVWFTKRDVLVERRTFKLSYTCKVTFSRATKTKELCGIISHDIFNILDATNDKYTQITI